MQYDKMLDFEFERIMRRAVILLVTFCVLMPNLVAAKADCRPEQVLHVERNSTLAFEGDSLTYGYDTTEKNGLPPINNSKAGRGGIVFPEQIERLLHHQINVINRGYPGDRTVEGLRRWAASPATGATVIMYGTNDFRNYGGYPDGPLSLQKFEETLQKLVQRRRQKEGSVLLLIPPGIADPQADMGLEIYRDVIRKVGERENVAVFDIRSPLLSVANIWTDGLHLSGSANQAIAQSLSQTICITDVGE